MAADFDEDLRAVLRRAGCKNEKIVFILDESNILESSFLERMNTLLANGEVSLSALSVLSDCLKVPPSQAAHVSQKDNIVLFSEETIGQFLNTIKLEKIC